MARASCAALTVILLPLAMGCSRGPLARFETGVCWIAAGRGAFVPLDPDVANLETCGARLEVVYLLRKHSVTGVYGGVYVYVDATAIDAQAPDGPKVRLIDPSARLRIDKDIALLLQAHAAGSSCADQPRC